MIDYDPSIAPPFGYARGFQKPTDWCRTVALCSDEFVRTPLLHYVDEAGFWFSDLDSMYVRYVSLDPAYGMNLALWPESFKRYVSCHFATRIIKKLSNSDQKEQEMLKLEEHLEMEAKNDSMRDQPTKFPAMGAWSRSRMRWPYRKDGGNISGNLTG
jgi:hypothetical protein